MRKLLAVMLLTLAPAAWRAPHTSPAARSDNAKSAALRADTAKSDTAKNDAVKNDAVKNDNARLQPCAEAKTPGAANDCFAKLYVEADAQLNAAYNKIFAAMKNLLSEAQRRSNAGQIAHQQAAMDRLLAAQRAWLNYRDLHCDSVKFQYEGGTLSPTAWSQCMTETTQQRIAALAADYDLSN